MRILKLDDPTFKTECYQNISLLGCLGALPIIKKYNGERGPSVKILSYSYYIVLLLVLLAIKIFG